MADATAVDIFKFDNSYARLPEQFGVRMAPIPVGEPRLLAANTGVARLLGVDAGWLASAAGVAALAGNVVPLGAEPMAMAYAGHQFGGFSPQLGDGRAILLGETVGRDGVRRDVQLKGSGRTPFSRGGDGRAAVGPVLREYIMSEAFAALGIPTTRSLAAVATGETVRRETELPGAVLTRVAQSHVRVGTFQYFAARGDVASVRLLADYVIGRHYPDVEDADNRYVALLEAVMTRQAALVSQWQHVGFIHGVMNTDNTSIVGETIDFGPCAFMDGYNPSQVYSSIDHSGRYAYDNQPRIVQWNLARLAETLLPLLADDEDKAIALAQAALDGFAKTFADAYTAGMRRKLGLIRADAGDLKLGVNLLELMAKSSSDFTLTWRKLSEAGEAGSGDLALRAQFTDANELETWLTAWRQRSTEDGSDASERRTLMQSANPAFIPRNHRVEEALAAATVGDLDPFHALLRVLAKPYDDQPEFAEYQDPPRPDQIVRATFCGT